MSFYGSPKNACTLCVLIYARKYEPYIVCMCVCVCLSAHVCFSLSILQSASDLGVIQGKGRLERVENEERMRLRDTHIEKGFK